LIRIGDVGAKRVAAEGSISSWARWQSVIEAEQAGRIGSPVAWLLELKAMVFVAAVTTAMLMRMEAHQWLMKLECPEQLSALGLVSRQFSSKAKTTVEEKHNDAKV
jgi:hypothetical protein